jgi:two-component system sensor histidine kinase CpxA
VNTLFTKIFLWFIGTAALALVAFIIVAAVTTHGEGPRYLPLGAMLSVQLAESRRAYEFGGPEALRETLERFRALTEIEGVLTDASGRDLVTGKDRSDLVKLLPRRGPRPLFERVFRLPPPVIARPTRDGRYVYFLLIGHRRFVNWFFQPELHIAVLGLLAILCYAFARHLTKPVRQLQTAVQRFGQGDLSARVHSRRRDELGQLARTFDQMADRTETLLTAERRLLLDISHELRSPLARLAVAVELARSSDNPNRELDRIQREADRLNALVSELLQVTRAEGDAARLRSEPVPLHELVIEVSDDVAMEAAQRGCRIERNGLPSVTIRGDAELLRRAIENVMRNAARYAPTGTAVDVGLTEGSDDVHITIRDRGPGVPPESLDRIFHPFYRVESDRDRQSGGVGLGLAIARRAVELHHGSIAASNANPGLRVDLRLPK